VISDPDAEDHPWIKHQSFIAYQHCTELDRTRILNEHFHGELIMKEDITDELLQRIQMVLRRRSS